MSVQDTYLREHAVGFPGSVVNLGLKNIITKLAEASSIAPGLAVTRGTLDDQALLATATGADFIGITVSTTAGQANGSDVFTYAEDDAMNVLDEGEIYVLCEDGCVPGDDVFFRHTISGNEVLGAFRTDADTADADQIVGATFESTAGAGEIAIVKLP